MRKYKVVDAFTTKPTLGNPVAVVLDAEGLADDEMQSIARWTNLSETTFVLPAQSAEADYLLRIFTPRSELPFAGHPTLGSAHAIIEAGWAVPRDGLLVQECGVGLVTIKVQEEGHDRKITLDLPPAQTRDLTLEEIVELEAILGHPVLKEHAPAVIDVGAVWIVAAVADASIVSTLTPDFARSAKFERKLGATGITVFGKQSGLGDDIEVRSFAPSCGVDEDPVCGSGNGSVAVFRTQRGLVPFASMYVASQGRCVGRDGKVAISIGAQGQVSVGGSCVTCVDGVLTF
ncbi:phenazine biosynthesis protein PhzF [Ensifer adhaerens]|uniref:Phenazine biosynthesis protein PhzF n=1 Tax=Ensifer adhaerens TaxID=106592 RepID=A0A0L8BGK1_ENSAD|nr:PhzF family phenazine biosynthesis protein [Ensifer adhaerens]KOF13698.1 phenazine biosynthesis protein PhzF [Ensifer adhaerens]